MGRSTLNLCGPFTHSASWSVLRMVYSACKCLAWVSNLIWMGSFLVLAQTTASNCRCDRPLHVTSSPAPVVEAQILVSECIVLHPQRPVRKSPRRRRHSALFIKDILRSRQRGLAYVCTTTGPFLVRGRAAADHSRNATRDERHDCRGRGIPSPAFENTYCIIPI